MRARERRRTSNVVAFAEAENLGAFQATAELRLRELAAEVGAAIELQLDGGHGRWQARGDGACRFIDGQRDGVPVRAAVREG